MPALIDLGRLESVDLRTCWENEATSFTPWLALESNLGLLGEAIELDLELAGQEQWVGPFRADILCKNMTVGGEGEWVLIENQLERTDHTHLGQLITYAAGLHACSIVWIARQFTDEHRAALDWLNDHTVQDLKFFGLEIQLWRIGDSSFAPKFNVVCRPNDYSRTTIARRDAANQTLSFRLKYWTDFLTKLAEAPEPLKLVKPNDGNWIGFSIGRTGFKINPVINPRDMWIRLELYLSGSTAKENFQRLRAHHEEITKELGTLEWEELPEKRDCRIAIYRRYVNPQNEADWPEQHSWLAQEAKRFHETFSRLIRDIDKNEDVAKGFIEANYTDSTLT